jgi:heptosyltransferase II
MKILVIRLSSLGDIVLTQPIMQRLHEAFPQAELHYLTKPHYTELIHRFGVPIKTLIYNRSLSFHYYLCRSRFDYVFDLHNKFASWLIKLVCCCAKSFTYDKQHRLRRDIVLHKSNKDIDSTLTLYSSALNKAGKKLRKLGLAKHLGIPVLRSLQLSDSSVKEKLCIPNLKVIIALFPGAMHYTKRYPADMFVKFINATSDKFHFWLLGSKDEVGITSKIYIASKDKSTDYGGCFSLSELIDVIALSDAVITNDSGPMHIAAALGKPQIAIWGATHPRLGFAPLNSKARLIKKDLKCQPCSLHGNDKCPRDHFKCMLRISPNELVTELSKLFC